MDQPPHVVHAFDTVSLALMAAVATFVVQRALWPMAAIGLLAVIGLAVWPAQAFLMHDLTIVGIATTKLWYLGWRQFARDPAADPGPRGARKGRRGRSSTG